jgi:hypothetical protein
MQGKSLGNIFQMKEDRGVATRWTGVDIPTPLVWKDRFLETF